MVLLCVMALFLGCDKPTAKVPMDSESSTLDSSTTDSEFTPPDDCAPVEGLAVTGVVATAQESMVLAQRLTATLSGPATVAFACQRADDPLEIHILEATGADAVSVDIAGLIAESTYHCSVAPICPESAAAPAAISFTTPALPSGMPSATVIRDESTPMTGGAYTMINHSRWCAGDHQRLLLYDPEGRIRWYNDLPFPELNVGIETEYLGNGQFYWGGGYSVNGRPEIDDLYTEPLYVADFEGSDSLQFHHESRPFDVADMMLSLHYTTNSDTDGNWWTGFGLVLHDSANSDILWRYDSQEGFDEGLLPGSSGGADAYHSNAADLQEVDGRDVVYVSLYNLPWVIAIDTTDNHILWRFGYGGDFTLVDPSGAPLSDDHFQQGQHGIDVNGDRIVMYDNGYWRGYSRAVEYSLDTTTMTATENWVWTDPGWYEQALGDVDWLPDNHILVTQAHIQCYWPGRQQQVVEVDLTTGEPIWRLTWEDLVDAGYRAERMDPCDIFGDVQYCPDAAAELERVRHLLEM